MESLAEKFRNSSESLRNIQKVVLKELDNFKSEQPSSCCSGTLNDHHNHFSAEVRLIICAVCPSTVYIFIYELMVIRFRVTLYFCTQANNMALWWGGEGGLLVKVVKAACLKNRGSWIRPKLWHSGFKEIHSSSPLPHNDSIFWGASVT